MWKTKIIRNTKYLFNLEFQSAENTYKLSLTDFCKLWCVKLSKADIVEKCKKCNQWLEAEDETLLLETMNLFEFSRNDVKWDLEIDQNLLELFLDSKFGGIQFCFRVNFHLSNEEDFFQIVISPLLMIIKNFQYQKNQLQSLIKKKDVEIAEYKLEGAMLSRKNVETPIFQENCLDNIFASKEQNIFSNRPENLLDDSLISSYNEVYSFLNVKDENIGLFLENVNVTETSETVSEPAKVSKKSKTDPVLKEEPDVIGCVPVQIPVKRKPVARKLKNL